MTTRRPVRLVTVTWLGGPQRTGASGDFVVSADGPVGELAPVVAALLGVPADGQLTLARTDGTCLNPCQSLGTAGVVDGARLLLVDDSTGKYATATSPTTSTTAPTSAPLEDRRRARFGVTDRD